MACRRLVQFPISIAIVLLTITFSGEFCGGAITPDGRENVDEKNTSSVEPSSSTGYSDEAVWIKDVPGCALNTTDPLVFDNIVNLLGKKIKLIEYKLSFRDYAYNPLIAKVSWSHQPATWARTSSSHGQTLLSLAFNYGVLSLMTLTFGTALMEIELQDTPRGCFGKLSAGDMEAAVIQLLLRDFHPTEGIKFEGGERVCHEIVEASNGYGHFTDQCCYPHALTEQVVCTTLDRNIWLSLLIGLLAVVRFSILFFGPLYFISLIEALSRKSIPYTVKLGDPLHKKICVLKKERTLPFDYKRVLDFRKQEGYPKLRQSMEALRIGVPTLVKIDEYDISVDYVHCIPENKVPVGLFRCLISAIFQCKLREMAPFTQCCNADMMSKVPGGKPRPWIRFFRKLGWVLMVLLFPFPYYLRLLVYYSYEKAPISHRKQVLDKIGLVEVFDYSLIHYLSPTHALFICIYIFYFVIAGILAYIARRTYKNQFKEIIVGSFMDLKNQSWVAVLQVIVGNVIWPFKRYGIVGCLIAPIYWLVVLPITAVVYLLYCLPTVYLTFRMLFYSKEAMLNRLIKKKKKGVISYRIQQQLDTTANLFNVETLVESREAEKTDAESSGQKTGKPIKRKRKNHVCKGFFEHLLVPFLCIITLYAVLFLLSECIGCLVEIVVFTLMGVIVNAGSVLKYVMLILLVALYSYNCFNSVPKKYLKLNKALFNEIKGRCKDLSSVTSLPSHLQENRGFKSQALSEQADHESPDQVAKKPKLHWMINDLTLFIDSNDTPRIPKKLFEEICTIGVAGAPGPVYRSLIAAGKQFLTIVCFLLFVFIIVLSFGAMYNISSTNQMLATAAGGFLPFMLKTFMAPSGGDLEMGTVSFKSKLDEKIVNFYQVWPMHDFPFKVPTAEDLTKKEELDNGGEETADGEENENHAETMDKNDKMSAKNTARIEVVDNTVDLLIYLPPESIKNWFGEDPEDSDSGTPSEVEMEELNANGVNMV